MRVRDAWNRPIASVPGPHMDLLRRTTSDYCWTFQLTGGSQRVLNLGSYNYLGFAESSGPVCEEVKRRLRAEGLGTASAPHELGRPAVAAELDALVAEYVGTEAALTFPMGYATNSMNIPALVGPGCLILSDELNHASLITGCKLAQGSVKRLFRHNDMGDLERKLREALAAGQPRSRRPWRKVLIVAEGVYSMEGTIARLPHLIALKKRYKAFLWLDEAHSVGAMGPHGRGVLDYWGCDPRDVDLLMGTFTKSFAAAGGYVAGSKALVRWLRSQSAAQAYGTGLSPPVAQQILSSMRVMMGRAEAGEGAARVRSLARNARYFRRGLRQLGLVVLGHDDSPVIPVMLWTAPACSKFSRDLLNEHGIAVVVAAFPATPITLGRARFCVSSAHTKPMIDQALRAISLLGDEMHLKHARPPPLTGPIEY